MSRSPTKSTGRRIVIYGVTGQLGRELVEELDASGWPIAELVGVASSASLGRRVRLPGRGPRRRRRAAGPEGPRPRPRLHAEGAGPRDRARGAARRGPLHRLQRIARGPAGRAPRASGCDGARVGAADRDSARARPSPGGRCSRRCGTPPASRASRAPSSRSAAAWGRDGVAALSDESIALFNQSEAPEIGPAGRPIAFDVAPGGAIDVERVRAELARELGRGASARARRRPGPDLRRARAACSPSSSSVRSRREAGRAASCRSASEIVLGEAPSLRDALGGPVILLGPVEVDASGATGPRLSALARERSAPARRARGAARGGETARARLATAATSRALVLAARDGCRSRRTRGRARPPRASRRAPAPARRHRRSCRRSRLPGEAADAGRALLDSSDRARQPIGPVRHEPSSGPFAFEGQLSQRSRMPSRSVSGGMFAGLSRRGCGRRSAGRCRRSRSRRVDVPGAAVEAGIARACR